MGSARQHVCEVDINANAASTHPRPRKRRFLDACDGPFPRLPNVHAGWLAGRLAGEHDTIRRAVVYIAEEIEHRQGARFRVSSRTLGRALGMSQSTGSRCLRKLRDLGILALWRSHRVTYKPAMRRWIGTAAVHEFALVGEMTHPYGDEEDFPPGGVSHAPPPGPSQ